LNKLHWLFQRLTSCCFSCSCRSGRWTR